MVGFSIVTYKNKQIQFTDYSKAGDSSEEIEKLFNYSLEQGLSQPAKTVLALVDFTNFHIDMDVINFYRNKIAELSNYKKIAVIGLKGVVIIAYNFFINLASNSINIKTFDTELNAKEWLSMD